jgi:hypothetical protein
MNLRRCPGCHNLIARESLSCPICGRTYAQVITGRIVRWVLTSALILWLIYEVAARHRLQAMGG